MSDVDIPAPVPPEVEPPTKPGFYRYSGGRQNMLFLLSSDGQWCTYFDNGDYKVCDWGYIEQALSVWDLIPLENDSVDSQYPDLELSKCEDVESAVFQALGAASSCWTNLRGAGEFDSSRCKNVGEQLVKRIREFQPIYG